MDNEIRKKKSKNRLLAALYAGSIYALLVIIGILPVQESHTLMWIGRCIFLTPIIIWIICLVYYIKNFKTMNRQDMFDAIIIMKYMLIPLFIAGGFFACCMALLSFIPVVFMIFVGPMAAISITVTGWCLLMSGLVFSIPYFIKAKQEKSNGTVVTTLGIICQFFFCLDVISIMILTIKEKRWRKLTISLLVIAALLVVSAIAWIVFHIIFG